MLLKIWFPQWQGSGEGRNIERGSAVLRPWLGEDTAIAIQACPVCLRQDGIDHLAALAAQLQACAERIAQSGPARILLCGGDCASEIAPVAHLNQYYQGGLNVVWLDAHADLNTPQSSPSGHLHGMPLRLLLGEGHPALLRAVPLPLRPEQVHLAGVRDIDPAERAYIETHQLVWHEVASLEADPARLAAGLNPAWPSYLHIDLDVLDPAENPAVQCPTPGGLSRRALEAAILAVSRRTRLAGAGLTECTAADAAQGEAAIHILKALQTALS
ncbi:arginase family protein [Chromobacterium sp. IIBBL 290-4]|uniref:arginase family protein n=1 Tax=Chromobacterium sp. IIBBL 290-4 TaxID=2953890 RepID=UPI0020B8E034|nr:arginase family protein [Chromobacterium sp. IIBBL 290-4]UTH75839.1 arginase family protein [Chromobacterium sp. IIBBL 290-4]